MSAVPADVLAALGRLNAHARGERGWSSAHRAIYAYKTLAAIMLVSQQQAKVRLVRCAWPCSCDRGWYWRDHDDKVRCRYCYGSGERLLRFTETTLPGGQVWHHPWEGPVTPGYDVARAARVRAVDSGVREAGDVVLAWEGAGGWRPRLPAQSLARDELVTLLNQVEDWVEGLAPVARGAPYWWHWESAARALHQIAYRGIAGPPSHDYRIDLGPAPGGCYVCGASDDDDLSSLRIGRITPLFHWSLAVCHAHEKSPRPDDLPPPELITPAIARWRARHERVVEAP